VSLCDGKIHIAPLVLKRGLPSGLVYRKLRIPHEIAAHALDCRDNIGKRAVHQVALPRDQLDQRADLPNQAPEAVVLQFEDPILAGKRHSHERGEHQVARVDQRNGAHVVGSRALM
jgi:hypothetical protein